MVFNAIFNNISVLLVEETGVPVENHRPVASHWQTVSHNVVSNRVRIHNIIGDRYYWQSLLGEGILSLWLEYHPISNTEAEDQN
jgi:hypothetical protein